MSARAPVGDEAQGLYARVVVPRARFDVDVTIEAARGETVAVMGPSGAGKSTLLGAIAGLESLAGGEVRVGGRVVDRVEDRLRVAPMSRGVVLLGQEPRLFPHLTARENVAFGPRAAGVGRAAARATAEEWLDRVGLAGSGDRRPAELSGGEQQRVAVARALAASPRAVLLDEPLVALDPETAGGIRRMLRDQLEHRTVLAVTHDAVDALGLADRLVVIEAGRVTQEGSVRDVLTTPGSAFVAALAGVNRVVGRAERGGWAHEGVWVPATDAASVRAAAVTGAPVAAVFLPGAVRVRAEGSAPDDAASVLPSSSRVSWRDRVRRLEQTPAGVRIHTEWCTADVSVADAIGLAPGAAVRLSVAAADVRLLPAEVRET